MMTESWPWLTFAGLGAFHGLNPAMGWLFAVALALHRQSRATMWLSLLPIAIGHLASIAIIAGLLVAAGTLVPPRHVQIGSGLLLLAWAAYHWRFGHRHRVRFGMQVGMIGLGGWSFLMATAHGAGLMLWPALMPLCISASPSEAELGGPFAAMLTGIGLHTAAMAATTVVISSIIYEWLGLAVLKSAWLNVDLLWVFALAATGASLLIVAGI
jgi:hypothetical protein